MKLFTKVMAAALLSTAISGAVMAATNFADTAVIDNAGKPGKALTAVKAIAKADGITFDITLDAGFVDSLIALDTVRFTNAQTKNLMNGMKGLYTDLTAAAGSDAKLKTKLATPTVAKLVLNLTEPNADYKNVVNTVELKRLADAVVDDPFKITREDVTYQNSAAFTATPTTSVHHKTQASSHDISLTEIAEERMVIRDISVARTNATSFILKINHVPDKEIKAFIEEKSITDITKFKRCLKRLIEGKIVEGVEVSNHIYEQISFFQQKRNPMIERLRQISFLEVEGDSRWFNPFYEEDKHYRPSASSLTHLMQAMIDYYAYLLFAPAKLMVLRAQEKIKAIPLSLKQAYLLYQTEEGLDEDERK